MLPSDTLSLLLWIQARLALSTRFGLAWMAFLISTAPCFVSVRKYLLSKIEIFLLVTEQIL
jgi:hypothetical protein